MKKRLGPREAFSFAVQIQMHRRGFASTREFHDAIQESGVRVNATQLWRISRGRFATIRLEVLVAMCAALRCTATDLIDVEVPMETEVHAIIETPKRFRKASPRVHTAPIGDVRGIRPIAAFPYLPDDLP